MKYHSVKSLCAAFALLLLFHAAGFSAVPQKPVPARSVNDLAGVFTAGQSSAIESELSDFARRTGNQFVVVTVPELYGMDKADLAYSIGEEWGVGSEKFDNGLVILVKPKSLSSNGEVFIAVGYGLEGAITDILCKRVIENEMIPHFAQNDYFSGVQSALEVLMPVAEGEYSEQQYMEDHSGGLGALGAIFIIIIIVLVLSAVFKGGGGSQNMGGRGRRSPDALDLLLLGSILGRGGRGSFGGGTGGGFGGGGFGGFGGGSFGGGGAGGSW